ncbi:MAG: hypothetical protein ACRBCK_12065 [Alphaproteobacteria bacterium]
MKTALFAGALAMAVFTASYGIAATQTTDTVIKEDIIEHGGGCRKSSPAGQCCHKNHKTGTVHCH